MALYSWFSKNNNKPNKTSVGVNNTLLKVSESPRYIENYTMWPTAKIKPSIEATATTYNDVKNKLPKEYNEPKTPLDDPYMSLAAALLINK